MTNKQTFQSQLALIIVGFQGRAINYGGDPSGLTADAVNTQQAINQLLDKSAPVKPTLKLDQEYEVYKLGYGHAVQQYRENLGVDDESNIN